MAIAIGLIPMFHTAVKVTTDCNAHILWLGFLAIRLVSLYISELPWSKVGIDFQCDRDTSAFCTKACFKAHFKKKVVSLWSVNYVLFIISVLFMELFAAQLHYNLIKAKMDIQQQMLMFALSLAYILLRLHIELAFLYILMTWHLPKLEDTPIVCSTWLCPGPYECIVRYAFEGRMMAYILGSISIAIICYSFVYAVYTVCRFCFIGPSDQESRSLVALVYAHIRTGPRLSTTQEIKLKP